MTVEEIVAGWREQLEAGEQAARQAASNGDLTPAAQQAAASKVRDKVRSDVLSSARATVEATEKAFVEADAAARDWDDDFEGHRDFMRLSVNQVEVAAALRQVQNGSDAKAAIDGILSERDYYKTRALRASVPDVIARVRSTGGANEAAEFTDLGKRIDAALAALEPATVRTSKQLAQQRYSAREELHNRLAALVDMYSGPQRPWSAMRDVLGQARRGVFG